MMKKARLRQWQVAVAFGLFLVAGFAGSAESKRDFSFNLGDAILSLTQDGKSQLLRNDGSFIGSSCECFQIRYENGKTVSSVKIENTGNDRKRFKATFEDGASAFFHIVWDKGYVSFTLEDVKASEAIEQCFLFKVAVPNTETAAWVNTVTLDDGLRVGVMTASINTLPDVIGGRSLLLDSKGCSHTFTNVSEEAALTNISEANNNYAEFKANSELDEAIGWSVQGKSFSPSISLEGLVKLRARVFGDAKGESLKIQLDGADGCRDDYISIDFEGWKVCELDDPFFTNPSGEEVKSLSYKNIRGLNFYYNSLPANQSVRCLIDYVEAVYNDGNGGERVEVLEDFSPCSFIEYGEWGQILAAKSVSRHGLFPASCALVVGNLEHWKESIRQMQIAMNIPSPRLDGGWRGDSARLHESYFFLTSFNADEYEDALEMAKRGGFKQILFDESSWTSGTGHYAISSRNFPNGLSQLKEIFERFNKEGIRVGLHLLGASVSQSDPYMTPIPDKRFLTDVSAVLARDISDDPQPTTLFTKDDATRFPVDEDPYMGSGQIVRIDDELLEYSRCDQKGLYECSRGVYGTKIAEHKAGSSVVHFTRAYGYHLPDLDTDFIDEIATNFANVANQLPIDMIYFDGSELLQRPGQGGDHWYYNARLHKAFYDKLTNKNILFQASSCSPYSWHMIARNASADGHDDLKTYLEERSSSFDPDHRSLSYLDVGWYYAYDKNSTPDMYEYCLGATIGYDASFSFQTEIRAAQSHPFIGDVLDLIRTYEELRLTRNISPEVRKLFQIDPSLMGVKSPKERRALMAKRHEYRLEKSNNGDFTFRRVVYPIWQNVGSAHDLLTGVVANEAVKDEGAFSWNVSVETECKIGFQVHFTNEGTVNEDSTVVRPRISIFKKTDSGENKVGEYSMDVCLHQGQYAFSLPDKKTTAYGLPLTESQEMDEVNPNLVLQPGEYRIEFTADSGLELPIRVRTPLFTNEIITISAEK